MERHTTVGHEILADSDSELLQMAAHDRPHPSRALRRQRLPAGPGRRGDPDRGADRRRRRRLRRPAQRPPLPAGDERRGGVETDRGGARHPLRPRGRRRPARPPRGGARATRLSARSNSSGASSTSKPDRQADHVGDAPLDPLDQGRPERLDRVAAGAAPPLAEAHVALLLGLVELLEDDRRPLQARSAPRRRRGRPARSSPRARVPTCGPGIAAPRLVVGGLAQRLAVEHDIGVAGDHHARRASTARALQPRVLDHLELGIARRSAPRRRGRRPRTRPRASRGSPAAAGSRMRGRPSGQLGEPDPDLALGRLVGVGAVDHVEGHLEREVAADRAGRGLDRVGGADQLAGGRRPLRRPRGPSPPAGRR